jgi:hypothetical protein
VGGEFMNRLQNAQKQLDDALSALESAVTHHLQEARNPASTASDGEVGTPVNKSTITINSIGAIESDLEEAITILSALNMEQTLGDEV